MLNRFFGQKSKLIALTFLAIASTQAGIASADPEVKLRGTGTLTISDEGAGELFLAGRASHLGNYVCDGELQFILNEDGSRYGIGVVVLIAANGDLIVGAVDIELDADGIGEMALHWKDQVTFANGDVFSSTGRFRKNRPAGAITRIRQRSTATLDAGE